MSAAEPKTPSLPFFLGVGEMEFLIEIEGRNTVVDYITGDVIDVETGEVVGRVVVFY